MISQAFDPETVPIPGTRYIGNTRLRNDFWPTMARVLHHVATTGHTMAAEMIHYEFQRKFGCVPLKGNSVYQQSLAEAKRLYRAIDRLADADLILKLQFTLFQHFLYVGATLTEKGRELCAAYGWNPIPSDWDILEKHHQAVEQEQHSATVMLFAAHARIRKYIVTLVPFRDRTGSIDFYDPDLYVAHPFATTELDKCYVEVESTYAKDKRFKWEKSRKQQGFLAVCTLTERRRRSLVKKVREQHLACLSTDLSSLNKDLKYNPNDLGSLWTHWES